MSIENICTFGRDVENGPRPSHLIIARLKFSETNIFDCRKNLNVVTVNL